MRPRQKARTELPSDSGTEVHRELVDIRNGERCTEWLPHSLKADREARRLLVSDSPRRGSLGPSACDRDWLSSRQLLRDLPRCHLSDGDALVVVRDPHDVTDLRKIAKHGFWMENRGSTGNPLHQILCRFGNKVPDLDAVFHERVASFCRRAQQRMCLRLGCLE